MKINNLKMIMLFVKGITTTIGASLIISQKYPILTLIILGVGAGTVEVLTVLKESEQLKKQEDE